MFRESRKGPAGAKAEPGVWKTCLRDMLGRTAWLQWRFHNGKQCKAKFGKVGEPDRGKIAKSERGLPLGSIEPMKGKLTCVGCSLCAELCVNFFV